MEHQESDDSLLGIHFRVKLSTLGHSLMLDVISSRHWVGGELEFATLHAGLC